MSIGSLLVDFDGTASATDVASEVCSRFAPEGWQHYDESVQSGAMAIRDAIDHQARMLSASREHMLSFVLGNSSVDPGSSPCRLGPFDNE